MNLRYRTPNPGVIEQTAILRDIDLPEVHFRAGQDAQAALATYPWLVVLNQDCDLLFDRLARTGQPLIRGDPVKKDKLLRSVLLCPAFPLEHVLAGEYVLEARRWGSRDKEILIQNREDRYHVLPADEEFLVEALALDFKLIVAVHPEYLQQWVEGRPESVVAVLNPPFRDRLMQRFINYFGRIAEPGGE